MTSYTYNKQQRKRGTFWRHLFAGCIAGAVSRSVVAPLERIKIILQTQQLMRIPESDKYKGFIDALKRIPTEQGILSFWRGNGTNVLRIVPNVGLRFAIYDKFKWYAMPDGEINYKGFEQFARRLIVGFTSGMATLIMTYPFDIVRLRLSIDITKKQETKLYKGMLDCVKKMVKNEGVGSLYKGYMISSLGLAPYLALAFSTYDTLKMMIPAQAQNEENIFVQTMRYLGIGSVAGMTSQLLTHPLDTVRRRIQANGSINNEKLYSGTIDCIKKMYQMEGIRGYYNGLLINLIKIAPAAAIQFSVYDIFKHFVFD